MAGSKKQLANATQPTEPPQPSEDTSCFPFERLPPELRNAIYQEYLVCDQPIRITHTRVPRPNTWERRTFGSKAIRKAPSEYRLRSNLNGTAGKKKQATLVGFDRFNILGLNKAINVEGVKVLHGANTFSFSSMPSMMQFMRTTGTNVTLLRHVKVLFWNRNHIGSALQSLHVAEDLQSLELPVQVNQTAGWETFLSVRCYMEVGVRRYLAADWACHEHRRRRFDIIKFRPAYEYSKTRRSRGGDGMPIEREDAAMAHVKQCFEAWFVKLGVLLPDPTAV